VEELVILLKGKVLEYIDISDEISDEQLYDAIEYIMKTNLDTAYVPIKDRIEIKLRIFNSIKKRHHK